MLAMILHYRELNLKGKCQNHFANMALLQVLKFSSSSPPMFTGFQSPSSSQVGLFTFIYPFLQEVLHKLLILLQIEQGALKREK